MALHAPVTSMGLGVPICGNDMLCLSCLLHLHINLAEPYYVYHESSACAPQVSSASRCSIWLDLPITFLVVLTVIAGE